METLGKYTGGTFDVPVVIGASPDTNPVRYFKGKLTNVNIVLTDQEYYTVHFDANGGSGTMTMQEVEYGQTLNIKNNEFTNANGIFMKWNTKADGSGTDYQEGQSVKNLTKIANDTVELYTIWSLTSSSSNSDYVFTGKNYINTGIYLFNENTVNKDFEVSFEIVSRETSTK